MYQLMCRHYQSTKCIIPRAPFKCIVKQQVALSIHLPVIKQGQVKMSKIAGLRARYPDTPLDKAHVDTDPIRQFQDWLQAAIDAQHIEPNAMTLSTVNPAGQPSSRMVLLKGVGAHGFVFFTNHESHKGQDIAANPHVSLLFYWDRLMRQVRIQGIAEKVPEAESEAYFATRPRDSQIGAWVSHQSTTIEDRAVLENRLVEMKERFAGQDVPRPAYWGGYRVQPHLIEFWQGRPGRLHDRLLYTLENDGQWTIQRLSP
jgi:pyridoxamine 5'-phosphate oxidase